MITVKMALSHMKIAKKKGDKEKLKALWNTYYCQSRLITIDGRFYGKYCKNRNCTLCCSIRKAEIINKYFPTIREWKEPYFITLTVKSVKANRLRKLFEKMIEGFRCITAKYRKRGQREKGIKLVGIKSLECNFNPVKQTYNPHFHIIVASKEMGEIIINEWLAKWGKSWALRISQDIRPVKDLESNLIEIIKYGSKIFTEPDIKNRSINRDKGNIHALALYNIFEAMKGLRIFERFGFDLPKTEKVIQAARVVTDYYEWQFHPKYFDWLNMENELTLTGYDPAPELVNLLAYNIDLESE